MDVKLMMMGNVLNMPKGCPGNNLNDLRNRGDITQ